MSIHLSGKGLTVESQTITMLGTGLIGDFYTMSLHHHRGRDRVGTVYSRSQERADAFGDRWDIPNRTTSIQKAIEDPSTSVVVVALPNHLHEEVISMCADAGKAVLDRKSVV